MDELNINSLIVIKQLPIIEQMLEKISQEIDVKIETAKNLVPINADETLKYTKSARAELNKEFADLEERRKSVKKEVMKPYEDFEAIYKEKISNKFKEADKLLGVGSKYTEIKALNGLNGDTIYPGQVLKIPML